MLHIRRIDAGHVHAVEGPALADAIEGSGFVWVDICEPTEDEAAILHDPLLGLEPSILEDMLEDTHLPKAGVVGGQLLLVVHGLRLDLATVELRTTELDVAVLGDLLVTFQSRPVHSVQAVRERLDQQGPGTIQRPMQLVHLLVDTMNDVFVPFVDLLDRRLDVIEEDILTKPTEATRHDIYRLQRDVIQLRRALVPQAEVIRRLGREPVELLTAEDRVLFADIHDHLYRMVELSDSYRQLLESALQSYRSSLDDSLNGMLATLTIVSAVLLPISVIAGIYGTNFEYIPELGLRYGYFGMWGVFVLIITGMLLWFRRQGWIGRRAERAAAARRTKLDTVLQVPVLGTILQVPAMGGRGLARTGRAVLRTPGRLRRRHR